MREIHEVATEIAERSGTVIPKSSPIKRMDVAAIGAFDRWPKPQIPVDVGWFFRWRKFAARILSV